MSKIEFEDELQLKKIVFMDETGIADPIIEIPESEYKKRFKGKGRRQHGKR